MAAEWLVVLIEGALACLAGYAAWRHRGRKPAILFGIVFGMMLCMLAHGFGFGVLRVESPSGERNPALLVGFGIIAAVMVGFPLGLVVGVALYNLRPRGPRPTSG